MRGLNMAVKKDEHCDGIETDDVEIDVEIIPDEDATVATGYEIAICPAENEMRILFRNELGLVVSNYVCDASTAYEMASKILKGYDKLEGI